MFDSFPLRLVIVKKRIGGIILFGIPSKKDDDGMVSHDDNGIVQRAIKEIKKKNGRAINGKE